MASGQSRDHHWWPVALQSYWTDRDGYLSWTDSAGVVEKKKPKNRKIALRAHGHTIHKGSVWELNFEGEFGDIDNKVHMLIEVLQGLKPLGAKFQDIWAIILLVVNKNRSASDFAKFYKIEPKIHSSLLLLILSILIRSPKSRNLFERYSELLGLPSNESVGKANMQQAYSSAKKLCASARCEKYFFVVLHSQFKKFNFGDGSLDLITSSLSSNWATGKTLIPLTPKICVYAYAPSVMPRNVNCAVIAAPAWMVDRINSITQIYSRDRVFFLGKKPTLEPSFTRKEFLVHDVEYDGLLRILESVADEYNRRIL